MREQKQMDLVSYLLARMVELMEHEEQRDSQHLHPLPADQKMRKDSVPRIEKLRHRMADW